MEHPRPNPVTKVGSAAWSPASITFLARIEIRGIILPNTPAGGRAAISGSKTVGQVLTADTSGITDANGLDNAAFSYQWVRVDGNNERDIPGATGSSYTLVEADYAKKIKVRVSFVDDAGYDESVTSPATREVERGPQLQRLDYRPTRVELWYDESPDQHDPSPPAQRLLHFDQRRRRGAAFQCGCRGLRSRRVVDAADARRIRRPCERQLRRAGPATSIRDDEGRPAPGFTSRSAADVTGTWYGTVRVAMAAGAYQSTEPRTGQTEVTVGVYPRSPYVDEVLPPDLEFWVEIETSRRNGHGRRGLRPAEGPPGPAHGDPHPGEPRHRDHPRQRRRRHGWKVRDLPGRTERQVRQRQRPRRQAGPRPVQGHHRGRRRGQPGARRQPEPGRGGPDARDRAGGPRHRRRRLILR